MIRDIRYIFIIIFTLVLCSTAKAQQVEPKVPSLEERLEQRKRAPKEEAQPEQGNATMYQQENIEESRLSAEEQSLVVQDTVKFAKTPKAAITQEIDTIANTKEDFYTFDDSLMFAKGQGLILPAAEKKKSASHAAFLSALVPGLGQIYSGQQIWMVPVFWGGLIGTISAVSYYNGYYNDFRSEYKYRINHNITDPTGRPYAYFDNQTLVDRMQFAEQQRDLWILGTVGVYLLNVLHANVSVQLSEFRAQKKLEKQRQQQQSQIITLQPTIIQPNKGLEKGSTPGLSLAFTF